MINRMRFQYISTGVNQTQNKYLKLKQEFISLVYI